MTEQDLIRELAEKNSTKIVMLVADGLGGLPLEPGGRTELETARTPNLDRLAARGTSGGSVPVLPGITPGSGPGHLGLFGYDPLAFKIGRGALEALGVDFELGPDDVAARGNFCTVDAAGSSRTTTFSPWIEGSVLTRASTTAPSTTRRIQSTPAVSFPPNTTPASARVTVNVFTGRVTPMLALNSTLPVPAVSVRSLNSAA